MKEALWEGDKNAAAAAARLCHAWKLMWRRFLIAIHRCTKFSSYDFISSSAFQSQGSICICGIYTVIFWKEHIYIWECVVTRYTKCVNCRFEKRGGHLALMLTIHLALESKSPSKCRCATSKVKPINVRTYSTIARSHSSTLKEGWIERGMGTTFYDCFRSILFFSKQQPLWCG